MMRKRLKFLAFCFLGIVVLGVWFFDDLRIQWIVRQARHGDEQDVFEATTNLREIGSPAALTHLVELLEDPRPSVVLAAAGQLGESPSVANLAVPYLTKCLGHDEWFVQQQAAHTLAKYGAKAQSAVPELVKCLSHRNPFRRMAAAGALGPIKLQTTEVIDSLTKALADPVNGVRRNAAYSLSILNVQSDVAVPVLMESFGDEEHMQLRASEAISRFTATERIVSALAAGLKRDDDSIRHYSALTLGRLRPIHKAAIHALVQSRKDYSKRVRGTVRRALREILESTGDGEDLDTQNAILLLLSDESLYMRIAARESLLKMKETPVAVVNSLLEDIRLLLAWKIGEEPVLTIGDPQLKLLDCIENLNRVSPIPSEVVPVLIDCLDYWYQPVRDKAIAVIGSMGPRARRAVPRLTELVSDRAYWTRLSAIEALGQIGVMNPTVETALENALGDSRAKVRQAAKVALARLRRR